MTDENDAVVLGAVGALAAAGAYAVAKVTDTDEGQQSSTQPAQNRLSPAALLALLSARSGSGGDAEHTGENPMEHGDTENVLDDSGRYPDEQGYSGGSGGGSPDSGASGEQPSGEGYTQNGYRYTGSDRDTFELWVSGDIGTQEFQQRTQPGEGTAAVLNWGELGDPETDSTPNVVDGGQPTTAPTTEADATSNPDPDDYYDPGMSEYIRNNPGAEIGDFGQYEGYHVFRDDSKLDIYEWVVIDDSGGWKAFDTESAAESFLDSGAADSPDAGNYGDIDDPSTDPANEGDAAHQGENPQDYGDTDDALGGDGSYSAPDDGASGEPAHRGADPTQYGDRFS